MDKECMCNVKYECVFVYLNQGDWNSSKHCELTGINRKNLINVADNRQNVHSAYHRNSDVLNCMHIYKGILNKRSAIDNT